MYATFSFTIQKFLMTPRKRAHPGYIAYRNISFYNPNTYKYTIAPYTDWWLLAYFFIIVCNASQTQIYLSSETKS